MYDRILIPVDGSDEAKQAAKRGLELAQAFDATVDVLYVVDHRTLQLTRSGAEESRLQKRGETALSEIEDLSSELGYPLRTDLVEGNPAVEIGHFAAETDADLIVVGRQGTTGLGRRLLGGVTEQVIHRSDRPVLVVPEAEGTPEQRTGYSDVLLPTDGSENAETATPHALAIARRFESAVHVLNIVDLQEAGGLFAAGGLEKEFVERLEARGREAVERVAADIEAKDLDVAVDTSVERTTSHRGAAAGIRQYVVDHDVDMLAMGSHGRSNLKRQLLGSVASTVLRTVDVPVLVVKRTTEGTSSED